MKKLKRTVIGITFLFAGIYLFSMSHKFAVQMMPLISEWSTKLGKYGQALYNTGGSVSNKIGILFTFLGVIILLVEYISDMKKNIKENQ